jgi:type IX secretion system PorP/SprF family membrane protein
MKIISNFKCLILIFMLSVFCGSLKSQQNIQFTQYIFNSIAVNPAYAGNKEEWYVQTSHRMQWMGMDGAPTTFQISADGLMNNQNGNVGLGFQVTSDNLGPQSATSFYANYAYRIRLDEADTRRLSFGLAAGITQYAIDGSILKPNNTADPVASAMAAEFLPNVRAGLYYTSPKWYVGLSTLDLLSGADYQNFWIKDTVVNIVRRSHYYFQTGGFFNLNEFTRLRPGILWKEDFHGPSVIDLNAMFIFGKNFWLGASYRTGIYLWEKQYRENQTLSDFNAVAGIVQFVWDDQYRIGYSYDYMLNGLMPYQRGTHEITLGYLLRKKSKRILSPRFF